MHRLYAPWRSHYTKKVERSKEPSTAEKDCVFCRALTEKNDAQNLILKRYQDHAIFINKYPYNPGHLLIIPYAHIKSLEQQTKQSRSELIELTNHCCTILKDTLKAEGVNIGINLEKAAGAGIPAHLHTHILPRWLGDTNFLPTLTETKQVSVSLEEIYEELLPCFK